MNAPKHPPLVISIQSQVVFGHVGNSAAVFPMQATGLEVAAIPTVLLSNTPFYPTLRGAPLDPVLFADLLRGALERDLPKRAKFLLTGYIGSVEVARLTAEFVARCKEENPALIYVCDPVMGDHEPGLYVPGEIADVMRDKLLPLADIATPNSFEIGHLSGRHVQDIKDLQHAAESLQLRPEAQLIVTGCQLEDTPKDHLESVILGPDCMTRHKTPHIPAALSGTGDLFTALVIAGLGHNRTLPDAVDKAQLCTSLALEHALRLGMREVTLTDPEFRKTLLNM